MANFLRGDWRGAVAGALFPLLGMLVLIFVLVLITGLVYAASLPGGSSISGGSSDSGTSLSATQILFASFSYLVLSVGGSLHIGGGFDSAGGTERLTPLLASLIGFGLMYVLFVRRARRRGPLSTPDAAAEALRTALVFLIAVTLIAAFTRSGSTRAAVGPTFGWALLFTLATLAIGVVALAPATGSAGLARALGAVRAPLRFLGFAALGELAVATVYLIIEVSKLEGVSAGDRAAVVPLFLLFVPNLAIRIAGVSLGAPLHLGTFGSGSASVSLSDLFDHSGWYWLFPIILAALLVLAARSMVRRCATTGDAQRACAAFVGLLAFGLLLATAILPGVDLQLGNVAGKASAGAVFGLALLWGAGAVAVGFVLAASSTGQPGASPAGYGAPPPPGYPAAGYPVAEYPAAEYPATQPPSPWSASPAEPAPDASPWSPEPARPTDTSPWWVAGSPPPGPPPPGPPAGPPPGPWSGPTSAEPPASGPAADDTPWRSR